MHRTKIYVEMAYPQLDIVSGNCKIQGQVLDINFLYFGNLLGELWETERSSFYKMYVHGDHSLYLWADHCRFPDFALVGGNWRVPHQPTTFVINESRQHNSKWIDSSTLRVAIVRGTSSPSTSFKKILLNDKSIILESSIALATNWPMTRRIWVRFLNKCY